jgi:hypothetical protein
MSKNQKNKNKKRNPWHDKVNSCWQIQEQHRGLHFVRESYKSWSSRNHNPAKWSQK